MNSKEMTHKLSDLINELYGLKSQLEFHAFCIYKQCVEVGNGKKSGESALLALVEEYKNCNEYLSDLNNICISLEELAKDCEAKNAE